MLVCKLKQLIETKQITLKELSKKANVNISTLQKYYNNDIRRIRFDTIDKLCAALNCNTDSLLKVENIKSYFFDFCLSSLIIIIHFKGKFKITMYHDYISGKYKRYLLCFLPIIKNTFCKI